jgi:chlorite dismutase
MEAQVIILQPVIDKLNTLVEILFDKDYFSIKENAIAYVDIIYNYMYDIPNKAHRRSLHNKNGEYFCSYKPNSRTTWYITFDIEDDLYNIKNITNNHSSDYARFIRGIKSI